MADFERQLDIAKRHGRYLEDLRDPGIVRHLLVETILRAMDRRGARYPHAAGQCGRLPG